MEGKEGSTRRSFHAFHVGLWFVFHEFRTIKYFSWYEFVDFVYIYIITIAFHFRRGKPNGIIADTGIEARQPETSHLIWTATDGLFPHNFWFRDCVCTGVLSRVFSIINPSSGKTLVEVRKGIGEGRCEPLDTMTNNPRRDTRTIERI